MVRVVDLDCDEVLLNDDVEWQAKASFVCLIVFVVASLLLVLPAQNGSNCRNDHIVGLVGARIH